MRHYFLLYDIMALVVGSTATFAVFILYLKTLNRKIAAYLWSNFFVALIILAVTLDQYFLIIDLDTPLREIIWSSIHFSVCGLCFWIPRTCRNAGNGEENTPHREDRAGNHSLAEKAFSASAITLAAALAGYYLFFRKWYPVFLVIYFLAYIDLGLACVYFGLKLRGAPKKKTPMEKPLLFYHTGLRWSGRAVIILMPFFLVTDFFGWLIPGLSVYFDRGFTLLPAFYIIMSISVLFGSALEILEPRGDRHPAGSPFFDEGLAHTAGGESAEPELKAVEPDTAFIAKYGLTKREAEIAPLVLSCLTYDQIAERLFISSGTVRTHLVHIYGKTGARNRLELSALIQRERRS